jgi:hypothetical protein
MIAVGDELTVGHDIIDIAGGIVLKLGEKVTIHEVVKTPSKWSNTFNMFMPEVIHGVMLDKKYGMWLLSCFAETKTDCK